MKEKVDYRIYLVTDDVYLQKKDCFEILEACLAAGVTAVQYRAKTKTGLAMLRDAERMKLLTNRYQTALIINDRVDLAMAVDAEGVHLGQNDLPYVVARELLGAEKEIGISANTYEEGRAAILAGADCIGIGPIYSTPTKKDAKQPCGMNPLRALKAEFPTVPVVAIGGITLANAAPVLEAGADGLAIISAIWASADPVNAVHCFIAGWSR
ncbi:MAG: thiamine-phosphate diphosphorylase [Firmicutes bacterium]|nr:thiamine-phosphate diphosphorylase [Bacillota bacterium]